MPHTLLLITSDESGVWPRVLRDALRPLGNLEILSRSAASDPLASDSEAVVIVDALDTDDLPGLLAHLKRRCPRAIVIVATASPTFSRARDAFKHGAADYIRKTLDQDALLRDVRRAIERLSSDSPR